MSETSNNTTFDQLTLWPEDFPVNRIRSRENAKAKVTSETSGLISFELSRRSDPVGSWLRTSLVSALQSLTGCLLIWKRRATPAGRSWWALGLSARHTEEIESGLSLFEEVPSAQIQMKDGKSVLVDMDDYEFLNQWKWRLHSRGYAYRKVRRKGEKNKFTNVYMHRLLMNPQGEMEVDHLNRNKLDNRKSNLRIVPHWVNSHNREVQENNSSGLRGVIKQRNQYLARIYVNGERIHLGIFPNKQEAEAAYLEAAKKYLAPTENLWPTVTVHGNTNRKESSEKSGDGLRTAATEWPTPCVPNGGRKPAQPMSVTGQTKNGKRQADLNFAVNNWPTPLSSDAEKNGPNHRGGKGDLRLVSAAIQWPTPNTVDARGGTRRGAGQAQLCHQAWPTPIRRDHRSTRASQKTMERNSRPLSEQIGSGLQGLAIHNTNGKRRGQTCLTIYSVFGIECGRTIRRLYERRRKNGKRRRLSVFLSARWVAQLMGYPAAYFDDTSANSSETESTRWAG